VRAADEPKIRERDIGQIQHLALDVGHGQSHVIQSLLPVQEPLRLGSAEEEASMMPHSGTVQEVDNLGNNPARRTDA
jgi:hypothetical protein